MNNEQKSIFIGEMIAFEETCKGDKAIERPKAVLKNLDYIFKKKTFKEILKEENLSEWKIKKINTGGGLVLWKTKEILLSNLKDRALFIHELAHILTKRKHDGVFADKFTKLVNKYY